MAEPNFTTPAGSPPLSTSNQNMPDYFRLENLNATNATNMANRNTAANRPTQINANGATSAWTQDANGNWTQTVTNGVQDQQRKDIQNSMGMGMLGGMERASNTPYDLTNTPQGNYNPEMLADVDPNKMGQDLSPFGNANWSNLNKLDPGFGSVQQVSDAMMGRMAPQRAQQRETEVQRLKNQGLTEGSEAFQRAMTRLDQGDTDANQQALLGGMSAYGDIFNRGLRGNQQEIDRQFGMSDRADAQRGQQFGENESLQKMLMALRGQQWGEQGDKANLANRNREMNLNEQKIVHDRPFNEYAALNANEVGDPKFNSFMGATPGVAPDYWNAANVIRDVNVEAGNKREAKKSGMISGLMGLGGSILGGPMGGMIGDSLGGMMGGGSPVSTRANPQWIR